MAQKRADLMEKLHRQFARGNMYFNMYPEQIGQDVYKNFIQEVVQPRGAGLLDELTATEAPEDVQRIKRVLSVFDGHIVAIKH
jgi:hypothetical protein